MATKTKTVAKKVTKAKANKPSVAKKVNTSLINVSLSAINTTIENGEKWQKLASKLIKKSEKVREQQINMIFDTAEAVKGQVMVGADKMKDLVGIDDKLVKKAKNKFINNPISKKVVEIVEDITESPMVQKAEKATEDMKVKGMAKFNELKGDVLKQAYNVVDKAENKLEDARKDLKKEVNKATKASKSTATKTKASKATKVVAKKAPKKTVAKKVTIVKTKAAPKKVVAKKATATKAKAKVETKVATKKVAVVKAKEVVNTTTKDDLKLIYGIGPKTEIALNNNGVSTYAEFAKLDASKVEAILEKEAIVFSNEEVKDWIKQAEVAVKDGSEGLVKWVERYRTA